MQYNDVTIVCHAGYTCRLIVAFSEPDSRKQDQDAMASAPCCVCGRCLEEPNDRRKLHSASTSRVLEFLREMGQTTLMLYFPPAHTFVDPASDQ